VLARLRAVDGAARGLVPLAGEPSLTSRVLLGVLVWLAELLWRLDELIGLGLVRVLKGRFEVGVEDLAVDVRCEDFLGVLRGSSPPSLVTEAGSEDGLLDP